MSLKDVLITEQLKHRPPRLADIAAELKALRELEQLFFSASPDLVTRLCQAALAICGSGSAGISILQSREHTDRFHWNTIVGKLAPFMGGCAPRHHSPCGICIERNAPQLFSFPQRYFSWMQHPDVCVAELLVVPLNSNRGMPIGTIWLMSHGDERKFDREDVRILRTMGRWVEAGLHYQLKAA